jgi:hypothetical protein
MEALPWWERDQLALLLSDPAAIGLQRLDAPDAAAAEAMVLDQHPDAQVHAVDGALVTEENRHPMANLIESWVLAELARRKAKN